VESKQSTPETPVDQRSNHGGLANENKMQDTKLYRMFPKFRGKCTVNPYILNRRKIFSHYNLEGCAEA